KARKAAPAPAKQTSKQDQVLTLLRRQNGASIDEIVAATDWQPHSVRGFLSGAVKKRLGIDVVSEKGSDGVAATLLRRSNRECTMPCMFRWRPRGRHLVDLIAP